MKSSAFMSAPFLVRLLSRECTEFAQGCQDSVQFPYNHDGRRRWLSPDRGTEQAHGSCARASARLGAKVRASSPGTVGGRFSALLRGRRAASRAHAPTPAPGPGRGGGCPARARRRGGHDCDRGRERAAGARRGAQQLRTALDGFDEAGAQTALDALFSTFTVETVLGAVILPYLADLGERWSTGEATVAQSTSPAT